MLNLLRRTLLIVLITTFWHIGMACTCTSTGLVSFTVSTWEGPCDASGIEGSCCALTESFIVGDWGVIYPIGGSGQYNSISACDCFTCRGVEDAEE